MPTEIVFQDNLQTNAPNLSDRFSDAVGFIIDAPLLGSELEIDVFLQIYFPVTTGEITRVVDLGRVVEQTVLINLADTETCQVVPSEFLDTGLEMALLFLASEETFLRATVVKKNCTVLDICRDQQVIISQIDFLRRQNELILQALGIAPPVIPIPISSANFLSLRLNTII